MRKLLASTAIASVAIVGFATHITSLLDGIRISIQDVARTVETKPTHIIYSKEPMQKTGKLSKIINGTSITLDYTWDCTADDWRRILALWKIICDNPPGE